MRVVEHVRVAACQVERGLATAQCLVLIGYGRRATTLVYVDASVTQKQFDARRLPKTRRLMQSAHAVPVGGIRPQLFRAAQPSHKPHMTLPARDRKSRRTRRVLIVDIKGRVLARERLHDGHTPSLGRTQVCRASARVTCSWSGTTCQQLLNKFSSAC